MRGGAEVKRQLLLIGSTLIVAFGAGLAASTASAEPYLAVEAGLKCASCHTNPSGGGKRSLFGMTYARNTLAARRILADEDDTGWNSEVTRWLGLGGDYRGGWASVDTPGAPEVSEWGTSKATAYLEIRPMPNLLTIYVDEQLAPDNSRNRETWIMATLAESRYTIKAGQFFLPFGLRLQDDTSFVRQRSGINFDTPDDGVELGLELPRWSAQAAFTNGTAGAGSAPGESQTSLSASYVLPEWRVGASVNLSDDPLGDREMLAVFAGLRTGPISWLAEFDFISDKLPGGGSQDIVASLLEGNWRFRKAHNFKLSYEWLDPDDPAGDDEQERFSALWEYSPLQLLQTRVGLRSYNGVPSQPATNREEIFVEAHVYF
jgi:hypothetical protein